MKHWNGSILDAYVPLSCPHAAESYNHRCSNESHSQSVTQTVCCSSRQSTAAEILSSLRRFPAAFKRVWNSVHDLHLCSYNKSNSKVQQSPFTLKPMSDTMKRLRLKQHQFSSFAMCNWKISGTHLMHRTRFSLSTVHGPRSQKQPWWKWRMDYSSVGAHCIRLLALHRSVVIF